MEKEKHFRLVELPHIQVLLTKDFDDDAPYAVSITLFSDEVKITQKMLFDTEEEQESTFNDLSDEKITEIVREVTDTIKN